MKRRDAWNGDGELVRVCLCACVSACACACARARAISVHRRHTQASFQHAHSE